MNEFDDFEEDDTLVVVAYDRAWPGTFRELAARLAPALEGIAIAIEHVGSTSVPGLAAKPIVDMDVVVRDRDGVREAIALLAEFGYEHRGDLGIAGRQAFAARPDLPPHNLYVCVEGSLPLRNHLAVRDALRADAELAKEYGELKSGLARRFPRDVDAYVEGKSGFLTRLLARAGLDPDELGRSSARTAAPVPDAQPDRRLRRRSNEIHHRATENTEAPPSAARTWWVVARRRRRRLCPLWLCGDLRGFARPGGRAHASRIQKPAAGVPPNLLEALGTGRVRKPYPTCRRRTGRRRRSRTP
ncbi:MAG: GrpB family protein [Planctomycetota bacterium]